MAQDYHLRVRDEKTVTVVVRMEQGETEAETTTNIIGEMTSDGKKTDIMCYRS